jgi:transcription antitermination factor NusG
LKDRLRVLQLPGVVRFVSFNGRPAVLPENDIEALRNSLAHRVPAESHPYLRAGHRVQVVSGPLAGTEGILVRKKDKLRVVISIEAIRRAVAVEIDQSDIEPIF